MKRLRGSVLLAWLFFAVIAILSLYYAGARLVQADGNFQKLGEAIFALVPAFFALPAALIITRQPGNTIGRLLMIYPLAAIPAVLFTNYLSSYQTAPPPATFLNLFMIAIVELSWMAMIFPILLVPLYFPTGRLISPRWRWTVYLTIGMTLFLILFSAFTRDVKPQFAPWTIVNPIGIFSSDDVTTILGPWSLLLAVLTIASMASVVVRYRRGSLIERQQIKWLLYACCLFGLIYIPSVFINTNTSQWTISELSLILFPIALMTIPTVITITIFRYHLFDIDVIIRRTLQYTLLTLLLLLVYSGSVILLQSVFRAVFGQAQNVAIVLSTLGIASLFNPLRRRVQAFIDRRFYRNRYDADKILADFGAASRSVVTMDLLTQELLAVVEETMHPEQTQIWLKAINPKQSGRTSSSAPSS